MQRPSQVTTAIMHLIIRAIQIKGINKVSFIAVVTLSVFFPNFYDMRYVSNVDELACKRFLKKSIIVSKILCVLTVFFLNQIFFDYLDL